MIRTLVAAPEQVEPFSQAVERQDVRDDGRQVEDALLDHADGLGEGVVRDVRPHDGQ